VAGVGGLADAGCLLTAGLQVSAHPMFVALTLLLIINHVSGCYVSLRLATRPPSSATISTTTLHTQVLCRFCS
jgi:hypothetical protein